MDSSDNLLERLRGIRRSLGLNQQEFGRRLGMALTSYASIEQGRNRINERFRKLLMHVYNVNLDYLDHGRGQMFTRDNADRTGIENHESRMRDPGNRRQVEDREQQRFTNSLQEPRINYNRDMRRWAGADESGKPAQRQLFSHKMEVQENAEEYHNPSHQDNKTEKGCDLCDEKERLIEQMQDQINDLKSEVDHYRSIIDYFTRQKK